MRVLTKPLRDAMEPPLVVAVKPTASLVPFVDVFRELFPTSASIFMYRDLTEMVLSMRGFELKL